MDFGKSDLSNLCVSFQKDDVYVCLPFAPLLAGGRGLEAKPSAQTCPLGLDYGKMKEPNSFEFTQDSIVSYLIPMKNPPINRCKEIRVV